MAKEHDEHTGELQGHFASPAESKMELGPLRPIQGSEAALSRCLVARIVRNGFTCPAAACWSNQPKHCWCFELGGKVRLSAALCACTTRVCFCFHAAVSGSPLLGGSCDDHTTYFLCFFWAQLWVSEARYRCGRRAVCGRKFEGLVRGSSPKVRANWRRQP